MSTTVRQPKTVWRDSAWPVYCGMRHGGHRAGHRCALDRLWPGRGALAVASGEIDLLCEIV
eukprot:SAG22_NODE_3580_length_1632_cov_50.037182_1_plen_60_part_10